MIKKFYSKRVKKHWKYDAKQKKYWSYGYDVRLSEGRGPRRRKPGFMAEADAIAAMVKLLEQDKEARSGKKPKAPIPPLKELISVRTKAIESQKERVRAARVLADLLSILEQETPGIKVDGVTPNEILKYVTKRTVDGLKPQSVNRELNIIAATLNAAKVHFPQMSQWITPKMPRPKESKARRERVYTDDEKGPLLNYLLAPQREGEQAQAWRARRRVGLQLQFGFLTGMRHGEIDHVRKEHVDFAALSLKVAATKTQFANNPTRYIPLTPTMVAILREFYDSSATNYVFTRSGNTIPNFYRILRDACHACGIPYGREVAGGVTFHDTRHTATTRMIQAGVDLSTIQSVTGHSDKTMVLYYSHPTAESRARVASVLEDYAGDAPFPPQAALSQEMLDTLFQMFREGKISQDRLAEILADKDHIPEELLPEFGGKSE